MMCPSWVPTGVLSSLGSGSTPSPSLKMDITFLHWIRDVAEAHTQPPPQPGRATCSLIRRKERSSVRAGVGGTVSEATTGDAGILCQVIGSSSFQLLHFHPVPS